MSVCSVRLGPQTSSCSGINLHELVNCSFLLLLLYFNNNSASEKSVVVISSGHYCITLAMFLFSTVVLERAGFTPVLKNND